MTRKEVEELLRMPSEIIYAIDDSLLSSKKYGFITDTGKSIVDAKKLHDFLEQLERSLPEIITKAIEVVESEGRIIENAKRQAKEIIRRADEEARRRVDNHEVLLQARQYADNVVSAAERKSDTIIERTRREVDYSFTEAEKFFSKMLRETKTIHKNIVIDPNFPRGE